ncbi:MAG TPA: helix-turn-helix domain-containing protein, partial [Bryobacteraceae bacterium]|nr:helix-turn-helix domain-containing protein [Bryobacteraceae bacterium]
LNVLSLEVPPLRERKTDIAALAVMFLEPSGLTIESAAQELLEEWHWPGNVRELRNVVTTAALFASGAQILPQDLPEEIRTRGKDADHPEFSLELMERRAILKVLQLTGNHQQRASEMLGISRRTLIRKLKTYREAGLLPASLSNVDAATELVA